MKDGAPAGPGAPPQPSPAPLQAVAAQAGAPPRPPAPAPPPGGSATAHIAVFERAQDGPFIALLQLGPGSEVRARRASCAPSCACRARSRCQRGHHSSRRSRASSTPHGAHVLCARARQEILGGYQDAAAAARERDCLTLGMSLDQQMNFSPQEYT